MVQKHSRMTSGGRYVWYTERLWRLSASLPVKPILIENIAEFDINCWFDEKKPPTC
ncbi:MAG TPA: hypothetical protein VGC76_00740 [Pyrinomonadaceae bacterium]